MNGGNEYPQNVHSVLVFFRLEAHLGHFLFAGKLHATAKLTIPTISEA